MQFDSMLKKYILARYGTLKDFAVACDISYNTMDSIFRRGTEKTSVQNIIRICHVLGISADDLVEGRIVPVSKGNPFTDIETITMMGYNLTVDGIPLTMEELETLSDCIKAACKIIRRNRK